MHQNAITVTLVRLFAVGLVIYAFRNASLAIFLIGDSWGSVPDLYLLIAGILLPAGVAAFLWILPERVIGFSLKNQSTLDDLPLDTARAFGVGVALIGIYLAATSAASIFDWFITHREAQQEFGELLYTSSASYYRLYSELFEFVVGALLFAGSSGITRVFLALRSYGLGLPASRNE